ncbi:hypothetical protein KAI87_02015, partial [Myxococcota bacterium]|nr:hypothetical protein [Myxococcota bacterium]
MSKIKNKHDTPIHIQELSAHNEASGETLSQERDDEFFKMVEKLEHSPSRQISHARWHKEDTVYHIVSRIYWGLFRLVPTPEATAIINGVFARARERFPDIRLYAAVVLSNHAHWQMQGKPKEVPLFIGYIKREISRRLGKE